MGRFTDDFGLIMPTVFAEGNKDEKSSNPKHCLGERVSEDDKQKNNSKLFDEEEAPIKEANLKALQEFENLLKREFNEEYSELIHSELSELEKISEMLGSVSSKLKKLYKSKFPKKCNNCGRLYETREDYITATAEVAQNKSLVYDRFGLQEYRNCVCGSTLMILTDDRRDASEFGIARRQLFDGCLEKLLALSNKSEEELKEELRKVFRAIIEEVNEYNASIKRGEL